MRCPAESKAPRVRRADRIRGMGLMRRALLSASGSAWLKHRALRSSAVRRGVSRFMPGEDVDSAIAALSPLAGQGMAGIVTHLGENITDRAEADAVVRHYLMVLDRILATKLDIHVSVKLTQLGLDLDEASCVANLETILQRARETANWVTLDMEQTTYTGVTLDIYRRLRPSWPNLGVALQAYLRRTRDDIGSLMPVAPYIRLVKGAYKEPPDKAFPAKSEVDANYLEIGQVGSERGRSQDGHAIRVRHTRPCVAPSNTSRGVRRRARAEPGRIPAAVRNPPRPTAPPRASRAPRSRARQLRRGMVRLVHAQAGRAPGQCLVRAAARHPLGSSNLGRLPPRHLPTLRPRV